MHGWPCVFYTVVHLRQKFLAELYSVVRFCTTMHPEPRNCARLAHVEARPCVPSDFKTLNQSLASFVGIFCLFFQSTFLERFLESNREILEWLVD